MEESEGTELDLSESSLDTLKVFMDETEDVSIFEEILQSNKVRTDAIKLVYGHPRTPDEFREEAARILSLPVPAKDEIIAIRKKAEDKEMEQPHEKRKKRISQAVERMTVSDKIKMAKKGNSEVRGILLRETNKMIVLAALSNPRITEAEIEKVANSRSTIEEAIREIAKNREWIKNYKIQIALVNNPKTPAGIAVRYIPYIKKVDLKMLEKNKNVSEAVRSTAKKMLKRKGV